MVLVHHARVLLCPTFLTPFYLGFQSLIPLSDRDFAQSNPSPPRAESSKTAGKRKRSSSARQSARQLAKSKATISSTDDDEDAQLPSAGPSKKAKYAPSRPHTKILSQEAFLEDARSLWQQTPAGLRANEPPPLIDAAQLKVFRRGFKAQVRFVGLSNQNFRVFPDSLLHTGQGSLLCLRYGRYRATLQVPWFQQGMPSLYASQTRSMLVRLVTRGARLLQGTRVFAGSKFVDQ